MKDIMVFHSRPLVHSDMKTFRYASPVALFCLCPVPARLPRYGQSTIPPPT